ncbi:hypothetical protein, partial [Immundisolibacter sp.]
ELFGSPAGQHAARSRSISAALAARARHRRQLRLFVVRQHPFSLRSSHWYCGISRSKDAENQGNT